MFWLIKIDGYKEPGKWSGKLFLGVYKHNTACDKGYTTRTADTTSTIRATKTYSFSEVADKIDTPIKVSALERRI